MVNLKDATKILNSGSIKYTPEQVVEIRDFLYALAQIEYEKYITGTIKKDILK